MGRRIAYWRSTALVALMLLMSLNYLTGSEQVVSGFARASYPQHLRIVLGIAKPIAAIVLLIPGMALLKEWALPGRSVRVDHGLHIRDGIRRAGTGLDPAPGSPESSGGLLRNETSKPTPLVSASLNGA